MDSLRPAELCNAGKSYEQEEFIHGPPLQLQNHTCLPAYASQLVLGRAVTVPGPLDGSAGAEYVLALTGAGLITPVSFLSSLTLQHHAESSINSDSALWDPRAIRALYGCHPYTAMTYQNDLLNL